LRSAAEGVFGKCPFVLMKVSTCSKGHTTIQNEKVIQNHYF